jgi:sigma-B regulation protein RsbU (phosphoserine phosphatase)
VGQYVARTRYEGLLRRSEERSTAIVAAALDCVVTMDHRGRVIDFNPAAEATFGCTRADALGRDLAELIIPPALRAAHRQALRRYLDTGKPAIIGRRLELTAQRVDGTPFPVELTVTRIGSDEPPAFAGFVRDLSDRRRVEDELARLLQREHEARLRAERAEQAARQVADALQRSLLPPHLPAIPGVELGAAYRAGGEGMTVGGDFYDVFDLGEGRWGVAIGDVRGKGAGAASVTALVRYTIRAAAVREHGSAAVLRALNEALLREAPDGGQFCTVVYAALDARPPAPPRLSLAVGGHPPPLLLDAGGGVTPVGRGGMLVGALPDPLLQDSELLLGPGDLLLLYTDGVTESRTPGGRFGTDRLAGVLARCAGLPAGAVVDRVRAAVADAPGHQVLDDVALLALRATG